MSFNFGSASGGGGFSFGTPTTSSTSGTAASGGGFSFGAKTTTAGTGGKYTNLSKTHIIKCGNYQKLALNLKYYAF